MSITYSPSRPPPSANADVEATQQWIQNELMSLLRALGETNNLELRTTYREPVRPRDGVIVHADGTSWNPGSGAGPYIFSGGNWTPLDQSGLAATLNYFATITDGSTPANASGSGTFKLRAGAGITIVTQNDDGTHGDNGLWGLSLTSLSSVASVALDDLIAVVDTSAANANGKLTVQALFNGVNLLTEDISPDLTADFLMSYDTSGTAAKKVLMSRIGGVDYTVFETATPTGVTNYVCDNIPQTHGDIWIEVTGLSGTNANAVARIEVSTDNGSTWETAVFSVFDGATTDVSAWRFHSDLDAADSVNGCAVIFNYAATGTRVRRYSSVAGIASDPTMVEGIVTCGPINAVRLSLSTGNIDAGTLRFCLRKG